jgi:hypothetical protein
MGHEGRAISIAFTPYYIIYAILGLLIRNERLPGMTKTFAFLAAATASFLMATGAEAQRARSMYGTPGAEQAPATTQTATARTASGPLIPSNMSPTLKVGQTVVIKGVRGQTCGAARGPFQNLPTSSLGRFSGGSAGTVNSRSCGGPTPARELRFTATKPGTETLNVFDDTVTITVR